MIGVDNPGTTLTGQGFRACNLCTAVEDGNATCWACVERWQWARGVAWHTELLAILRTRTPSRPCGALEILAFSARLDAMIETHAAREAFIRQLYAVIARRILGEIGGDVRDVVIEISDAGLLAVDYSIALPPMFSFTHTVKV